MIKVAVVTGIRSEYDILYSVLKQINAHNKLNLELIVTGTHLSEMYGNTIKEIENDGFYISDKIESLLNSNNLSSRVKSAGIQLMGLAQSIERIKPDLLMVLGDREESITTSMVGVYMNIPVAHIAGGDRVFGNVDDSIRHAVTKLSHIHFTTNEENSERIKRLGEEHWRVHTVGNPGLDRIIDTPKYSKEELLNVLNADFNPLLPFVTVIQHPLSSEVGQAEEQIKLTLECIVHEKLNAFVGFPNSDAGSQEIINVIEEYEKKYLNIITYKNLGRKEFVSLLSLSSILIGNSSCGILEAPMLKLPVINIGTRQTNRLHAENVIFVKHDKSQIVEAIKEVLSEPFIKKVSNCSNPYGDGTAGKKIADIIAQTKFNAKLINKDITY